MKQKIVVEVYMKCGKCRTKAMKIAAVESGVSSVEISGESKDQLVVIGEEVDSVCLTRSLRKKVGSARLVSVEQVKEKNESDNDNEASNIDQPTMPSCYYYSTQNYPQPWVCYQTVHDPNPSYCSIM